MSEPFKVRGPLRVELMPGTTLKKPNASVDWGAWYRIYRVRIQRHTKKGEFWHTFPEVENPVD